MSETDYILLSYDPCKKASIVLCLTDNSTYFTQSKKRAVGISVISF